MKKLIPVFACASLFLSSCVSKFSEKQRAVLSSVKIERTTIAEEAYRDPRGAADGTAGNVGAATGGGLVGVLIGEAVVATQNQMFKSSEGKHFAKLKQVTPRSQGTEVNKALTSAMKRNPFFASRIRSQSPNKLQSEITSYTLTRTGKSQGTILMSPQIVADVSIVGADGEKIGKSWLPVAGNSSLNLPISSYIAKPSLLKKGYDEAARNLAANFESALAKRTAE